ncbi:MAG: lectin-like domain-containing protein [Verrucomicrobiales bacterium]
MTPLAASFCLSIFTIQAKGAEYTQDFDFPNGTTDLGDGSTIGSAVEGVAGSLNQVLGGALRITENETANQRASFRVPALADSSLGWIATFDLTLANEGGTLADGFTLSYGDIPALASEGVGPDGHGGAEGGMGSTNEISFQFKTYNNNDVGGDNSPRFGVLQNRAAIPGGRIDGILVPNGGSLTAAVMISYTPLSVDFTTDGLDTDADFTRLEHTFVGDDAYSWAFSARTGGAKENLIIDNLVITTGDPDSDGDGLPNSWETFYGLDPDDNGLNPNNNGEVGDPDQGAAGDPDIDTISNEDEFAVGTNPMSDDTDMDGLLDQFEDLTGIYVNPTSTGTDPRLADTDDDGYLDGVEDNSGSYTDEENTGTDPNNPDSDEDGLPDGSEIAVGRDPNVPDGPMPSPGIYLQDFDGFPDGATNLGDGTTIASNNGTCQVVDGALRITSAATGNTRSSFRIPSLTGSSEGWTATFDYQLTDTPGGNPPADGFTLNYGDIPALATNDFLPDGHGAAEGGQGTGNEISFQVDTWRNDNANSPGLGIMVNAAHLPDGRVDAIVLPNDGDLTGTMTITWTPEVVSFETTGLDTDAAFIELPHTYVGDDTYSWVFSARTGGATEDLIIDNLEIRTGSAVDDFRITKIEKVLVTGEGGDPDTISVTVTWISQEGSTYGIYASPDMPGDIGDWEELDDSFVGEIGGESSYTETRLPVDTARRFYQIRDTTP